MTFGDDSLFLSAGVALISLGALFFALFAVLAISDKLQQHP